MHTVRPTCNLASSGRALRSVLVTDLTPEVANALVRLVNGELDYGDLDDDTLVALGKASRRGQTTLHEVVVELYRNRGLTFAQIGERLGATESAASRWINPPSPPGRRPRTVEEIAAEEGGG